MENFKITVKYIRIPTGETHSKAQYNVKAETVDDAIYKALKYAEDGKPNKCECQLDAVVIVDRKG